jgi:leucyl-tRNA synthetase
MRSYDHGKIEKKWQKEWEKQKLHEASDSKEGDNFYLLVEFPYPSGNLHVGHWYAFAVPDILARRLRMDGKNVLYPIGFDAFGLPAENAAIKNKLNPRTWTEGNIQHMKSQIRSMGTSFDWSREVITADPAYYRWTQWMFLQFFNKGLAYQKETAVNWCPNDKTVLANEQVVNGKCERCGADVEQCNMLQWNIKITDYADRLIDDLEPLDWPREIKESQKNWIGRSEGAEISFELFFNDEKLNDNRSPDGEKAHLKVFTTRPDTLFGATYMVLAPEHPWVILASDDNHDVLANKGDVKAYIEKAKRKTELERLQDQKDKTGIKLEGVAAINPATGEKIPVFVADYVLGHYGTGAIMAVPAHDKRDFDFAKKFDLAIREVISGGDISNEAYTGDGVLINSGEYDGISIEDAKKKMTAKFGITKTTYKIRDWVVSRQRYWGVPIPIIHCPKCGSVAVPDEQLPLKLPEIDDYLPSGDGASPLAKASEWVETTCPKCEGSARRETDTLDTFVDSSWYFLRYSDPNNDKEFASKEKMSSWMPVDLYSGGAEHTTMHLLYSRFWQKALFDLGLVKDNEPYKRRMNRSLILGPDGQKMSKSKGNVIDPDAVVENLGADTVRMYLAFIGPYSEVSSYPWNPDGVVGVRRFLERVWRLHEKLVEPQDPSVERAIHQTAKKVTEDIPLLKFNTAISAMMSFVNEAESKSITKGQYSAFLRLLAPFAPHMTEELWALLGNISSIHLEKWPKYDPSKLVSDTVTIAVQISGKSRTQVIVPTDSSEAEVRTVAEEAAAKWLEGKEISRVVFVTNRLINLVLA